MMYKYSLSNSFIVHADSIEEANELAAKIIIKYGDKILSNPRVRLDEVINERSENYGRYRISN